MPRFAACCSGRRRGGAPSSPRCAPAALIAAHRAARAGGPALVGHYHSHPGGSPVPSARDAAAAEPGSYWIIAGSGALRAWYADGRPADGKGRFRAVTIVEADNR
jgi:proteasome lid subunit RPN8/RPN11